MYELFLVACIGARICEYIHAPIFYPTENRCQIAAALVAGQVRGKMRPGLKLDYDFSCTQKIDLPRYTFIQGR